ncbi:MAG: hypothetical protein V1839_01155 [archaeon]
MMKSSKGIESIIAVLLVVMITIAAAGSFYFWYTRVQQEAQGRTEQSTTNYLKQLNSCIKFPYFEYSLYSNESYVQVQNCGSIPITIGDGDDNVLISSEPCAFAVDSQVCNICPFTVNPGAFNKFKLNFNHAACSGTNETAADVLSDEGNVQHTISFSMDTAAVTATKNFEPTNNIIIPTNVTTYWRDDFNDLGSWIKTGTDTMEIVNGTLHILTASDMAQLTTNDIMFSFDTTKDYTVKTRVKIAGPSHWLFFMYNNGVHLVYDISTLSCRYGNINTQIAPLTIGQWYDIQANVQPSSDVYDVYLNGTLMQTCSMPTDRLTDEFLIGDFEAGLINFGEMYFDYFEVNSTSV